jgi:tRNA A-37 threonylcarbamoyl transferase component Bud32
MAILVSTCEPNDMKRLAHGYTNETTLNGDRVRKRYVGLDAERRRAIEIASVKHLKGSIPVPSILSVDDPLAVTRQFVAGSHGQEAIDAGDAPLVLRLAGELLASLQTVDIDGLRRAVPGDGAVLVHGDFAPQNLLIDIGSQHVTAPLD